MTSTHEAAVRHRRTVEVATPARLHLGMLSFGTPAVRSYGGVGVMIDRPGVVLRVSPADRLVATGPLADRAEAFARSCAAAWGLAEPACRIDVVQVPASHVGLGSGTQLALAVAAGVSQVLRPAAAGCGTATAPGEPLRFSAADAVALARAVGRGRRSCVGIYGFGGGGLILEGGRFVAEQPRPEDDRARPFSPLLARVRLPDAWRCLLFSLRGASGLHGEEEKRAFAGLKPVPVELSAELARIAVMELVPAAVEGRFDAFARAVGRYGAVAGKPFEPVSAALPHADVTGRLFAAIDAIGVAGAAQSSWGPTIMACCESESEAAAMVDRFAGTDLAGQYDVAIARFDGWGATVRELPAEAISAR